MYCCCVQLATKSYQTVASNMAVYRFLSCGVLFILLAVHLASAVERVASVYLSGQDLTIKDALDKDAAVAYALYDDTVDENGWKVLQVAGGYSSHDYGDQLVMRAAGMLEGYLTQKDIYNMYTSLSNESFSGQSPESLEKVKAFYATQRQWMVDMIKTESDSLWYYAFLIAEQFFGMKEGYAKAAPTDQHLEDFAFDYLAGNGDYLDIRHFLLPDTRPDVSKMTKKELLSLFNKGHCSALIKILPGYENIYASHSSWYTYVAMNRIYKHYSFKVKNEFATPATEKMSFSSYPGYLSSLDDFYMMDSGLVMLQTTNNIFNKKLYNLSTPHALLAWHRVRLANWLATGGREWANYLSQYNSGTYNNQYMVLDLKKLELKKELHDDALWVVEQIPGLVESGDQTAILRAGYWPSYNVPFYENIFNMSGYPSAEEKAGTDVSYQLCPRAKIFRRDQGNVKDMESMQYIMRFNDYKNDPYSEGNPMNSICSRGDLGDPPSDGGCYDTKVTDYFMAQSLRAFAENGPTHQGLPPFRWSTSGLHPLHLGQPDLFNFTFVLMQPSVP